MKKIVIQLFKESKLTLINVLYVSNLKMNFINTAMLKKRISIFTVLLIEDCTLNITSSTSTM